MMRLLFYQLTSTGVALDAPLVLLVTLVGFQMLYFFSFRTLNKLERGLRESEERYRTTFDQAAVGIAHVSPAGAFLHFNKRWCEILGYTREELMTMSFQALTHPEDLQKSVSQLQSLLRGDIRTFSAEKRYLRKNGSTVWVTLTVSLVRNSTGAPNYFISVIEEITERKKAEAALRENEIKLNVILESTADGLLAVDGKGRVLRTNRRFAELWQIPQSLLDSHDDNAMLSFVLNQLIDPEEFLAKVRLLYGSAEKDQDTLHFKDGRVFERYSAPILLDGEMIGRVWSFRDVTEQNRAQTALRESEEKFRNLFNSVEVGMFRSRVDGTEMLDMNEQFLKIFNCTREEVKGTPTLIRWADLLEREEMIRRLEADGRAANYECRLLNKQGEVRRCVTSLRLYHAEGILEGSIIDITEQKQTEDALVKSKQQYDNLVSNIPVGIYLLKSSRDEIISFEYVSPRMSEILNLAADRILKDPSLVFKMFHAADLPALVKLNKDHIQDPRPFGWEGRILVNDAVKWVRIESTPEMLQNGNVLWHGVVADITKHKEAEEALRESDRTFRTLFESSRDALMTLTPPSWLFTSCNASTIEMFRTKNAQEFLSVGPAQISPELQPDGRSSAEKSMEMIERAMRDGSHYFEWTHRRIDGEEFSATVLLTRMELGGKLVLQATVRDITERKRAEQQIADVLNYSETIFEASPIGILTCTEDGKVVSANKAVATIVGATVEQLLAQNFRELKAWKQSGMLEAAESALATGHEKNVEVHHLSTFGKDVWLSVRFVPFSHQGQKKLLGLISDITERIRDEEALHQAQKLESIGTLAGGIAHDFNNVLGGIMGYTDMSLRHAEKDSIMERNLLKVLKVAERAKQLIQQILTFSRKANPHKSVISLRPILMEVLELLKASIPSSVAIESELQKTAKPVLADPMKIHEALLNLATNAVHAMDRKGKLSIRLYSQVIDHVLYCEAGEIQKGEYTVIEISDTGCGMAPEVLAKAFEPFFTTKPIGEGTGMGLSVVMGVVQSIGGGIQVDSKIGRGTSFRLYLPVSQETVDLTSCDDDRRQLCGTERILFVDDEHMLVEMAKDLLSPLGYKITGITRSLDALSFLKDNKNEIDILITDQTMPEMTGIELAKEVMTIRRDLPIILCSGYSNELNPERAAAIGINHLVMKPFRYNEMAKIIREAIDKRT